MPPRLEEDFDWRAEERRINEFPHFPTDIDGQTVHFIHVEPRSRTRRRFSCVHSYPGIGSSTSSTSSDPLADPVAHGGHAEDAFSVVVPSIPGFGFSTPLVDRGWTTARVARTFDDLMRRLGLRQLRCPRQ